MVKRLIGVVVILAGVGAAGTFFLWPRLHPAGGPGRRAWAEGNGQPAAAQVQPGSGGGDNRAPSGSSWVSPESRQHYEAGLALKKAGKYREAAAELQKALERQGDFVDAHRALAWTYVAQGQKEAAIVEFHAVVWFAGESEQGQEARAALGRLGGRVPPSSTGVTPPETNPPLVVATGNRSWNLYYCVTHFSPQLSPEWKGMSPTVSLSAENVSACVYSNGLAFLFDLEQGKYTWGYATDRQGQPVNAARILAGVSEFRLPPLALKFPVTPSVSSRVDTKGAFLVPQPASSFSWKAIDGDWKIVFSASSEGTYNGVRFLQDEVWLFDRERQLLVLVYPYRSLMGKGKAEWSVYNAQGFDLRAGRSLCGWQGAAWVSPQTFEEWKRRGLLGASSTESGPANEAVEGGLPATSRSGIPWTDGNVQSVEKTELRKLFDGAVRSLNERKPDPDQAIQQILQGVRKDPDNGYWYYLIAAAHVQKGQTEQALQDVKKGNQQAACYLYITRTGMAGIALMGPPLFPMRQLARDLVAQASHPGTEAGAEAILAVRTMGRKIAGQEPRDALSVLLCTHIHTIADQGLVRLYEQAGLSQQAQAARDREARDQQWGDSIRATIKELTAEWDQEWALFGIDIDLFAIDVDEFLSHPPPLPVWKQKMMEELCLKWQAKWRAAAEQALQTMPP